MLEKQQTIAQQVSISGTGLHTGSETTLTFKPAVENHGIKFVRADLPERPTLDADLDHVVDLSRGTTIGAGEVQIHTVEHVLAALYGLQIDNVLVEVTGNEPPVMDGSSLPFVRRLKEAGVVMQSAPREYIEIERTIAYHNEEKAIDIVIVPSPIFRVTYLIDYQNIKVGTQYTALYDIQEFEEEYSSARTFCYLSETEQLKEMGLIRGGTHENALVFVDRKITEDQVEHLKVLFGLQGKDLKYDSGIVGNTQLRYPNEPVRHKVLDLLGDLALLGNPIKGHVMAARAGHASHVEIAKQVRKYHETQRLSKKYQTKVQQELVFDIEAIMRILPHSYPFLLVDRILELHPGEYVTALKNVTVNEPFFQGHFGSRPIMPGVLIVESMGQAGGVLLLNSFENPEEKLVYFMGLDEVKFRKPVVPGDQLYIQVEKVLYRRNICKVRGRAYVGDSLAAEALMTAVIVDRDEGK